MGREKWSTRFQSICPSWWTIPIGAWLVWHERLAPMTRLLFHSRNSNGLTTCGTRWTSDSSAWSILRRQFNRPCAWPMNQRRPVYRGSMVPNLLQSSRRSVRFKTDCRDAMVQTMPRRTFLLLPPRGILLVEAGSAISEYKYGGPEEKAAISTGSSDNGRSRTSAECPYVQLYIMAQTRHSPCRTACSIPH